MDQVENPLCGAASSCEARAALGSDLAAELGHSRVARNSFFLILVWVNAHCQTLASYLSG